MIITFGPHNPASREGEMIAIRPSPFPFFFSPYPVEVRDEKGELMDVIVSSFPSPLFFFFFFFPPPFFSFSAARSRKRFEKLVSPFFFFFFSFPRPTSCKKRRVVLYPLGDGKGTYVRSAPSPFSRRSGKKGKVEFFFFRQPLFSSPSFYFSFPPLSFGRAPFSLP